MARQSKSHGVPAEALRAEPWNIQMFPGAKGPTPPFSKHGEVLASSLRLAGDSLSVCHVYRCGCTPNILL